MEINRQTAALILLASIIGGYLVWTNFIVAEDAIEEGVLLGNKAIDLTIPSITEGSVKISDFRGKIVILDFMAPWCPSCKEQIKVFKQLNDPEVVILTINIDPRYDMETLIAFGEDEGISWFFGHSQQAGLTYKVTGIPLNIIVDKEGIIRYRDYYTPLNKLRILIDQNK